MLERDSRRETSSHWPYPTLPQPTNRYSHHRVELAVTHDRTYDAVIPLGKETKLIAMAKETAPSPPLHGSKARRTERHTPQYKTAVVAGGARPRSTTFLR